MKIKAEIGEEICRGEEYKEESRKCRVITAEIDGKKEWGMLYPTGLGDDGLSVMSAINSYDNVALRGHVVNVTYDMPAGTFCDEILKKETGQDNKENAPRKYPADAKKAKEYDDLYNEGADGYNPYKN